MLKYIFFIALSITIVACQPANEDPAFDEDPDFPEEQDREMMEDNRQNQEDEFDQQDQSVQPGQQDPQGESGLQNQQDPQSQAGQQSRQPQSEALTSGVDVSDEELEAYAEVSLEAEEQDIDPLQEQEQMASILNEKDLNMTRYIEIENRIRQDQDLQEEVEEIKEEKKRENGSTVQQY